MIGTPIIVYFFAFYERWMAYIEALCIREVFALWQAIDHELVESAL